MSLHVLAHHMAGRGRGPDNTLVHMSRDEVAGLQGLAMRQGGSLTINPETGLPEAGFLSDLLKSFAAPIAGFALNTFLPGFGTAIGSALGGLSGAAGTAIGVGGLAGLASGSLSKGLMAGMGAYGGAGIADSLAGMGNSALAQPNPALGLEDPGSDLGYAKSLPQGTTRWDTVAQGARAAANAPLDFLKKNSMNVAMGVAAPAFSAFEGMTKGTMPESSAPKGNYRYMKYNSDSNDPRFGTFNQIGMNPVSEGYKYPGMAAGGMVSFGAGGALPGSDSDAVYKFLRGEGPNPYLTSRDTGVGPVDPVDPEDPPITVTEPVKPVVLDGNGTGNVADGRDPNGDGITGSGSGAMDRVTNGLIGLAITDPIGRMAFGLNPLSAGQSTNPNTDIPVVDLTPTPVAAPAPSGPVGYDWGAESPSGPAGGDGGLDNTGGSGGFGGESGTNGVGPNGFAQGGLSELHYNLGGYSDGGRLLRGPGDGISDSIPATIGTHGQPARLADGEFVVPARIVSELGNGSTEAGARALYKMMDRIQSARRKTTGKNAVAKNSRAEKLLPA